VELFEIRPQWDRPEIKQERSFAKTTFVRTRGIWRVFWMRADLKWHGDEPALEVDSIGEFLAVVDKDEYACFLGNSLLIRSRGAGRYGLIRASRPRGACFRTSRAARYIQEPSFVGLSAPANHRHA
jgi:hypothetical protein